MVRHVHRLTEAVSRVNGAQELHAGPICGLSRRTAAAGPVQALSRTKCDAEGCDGHAVARDHQQKESGAKAAESMRDVQGFGWATAVERECCFSKLFNTQCSAASPVTALRRKTRLARPDANPSQPTKSWRRRWEFPLIFLAARHRVEREATSGSAEAHRAGCHAALESR